MLFFYFYVLSGLVYKSTPFFFLIFSCRTFCFDPFLDLSVPIPRKVDTKGKWRRQVSREVSKCPLEECIEKFTGELSAVSGKPPIFYFI